MKKKKTELPTVYGSEALLEEIQKAKEFLMKKGQDKSYSQMGREAWSDYVKKVKRGTR